MNEDEWVRRRGQYLSSTKVSLREKTGEAVAWAQLGYTKSGVASEMGVTEGTAKKYLDRASSMYPGILMQTAHDLEWDPQHPVDETPDVPPSECPLCLSELIVSGETVEDVFRISGWGAPSMVKDAELVCTVCHGVRIDGAWDRAETVGSRAHALSEASSSHGRSHYRDKLTRGIDPQKATSGDRSTDDAEGW